MKGLIYRIRAVLVICINIERITSLTPFMDPHGLEMPQEQILIVVILHGKHWKLFHIVISIKDKAPSQSLP